MGSQLGWGARASRSGSTFACVTARAKGPTLPTIRPRHRLQSSPTAPRCTRARRLWGCFPPGARVRRREARTSGPVHRGRAVGSTTPPQRFRAPWLSPRPHAPCAGPGMRTEALGPSPGSAGARTVCRESPRPRGRGCMRRSFQASARSEQGRGRGREIDRRGEKTHACTYTLRMRCFADEYDTFRFVDPGLDLWNHDIRLARYSTHFVEYETQPGWGQRN